MLQHSYAIALGNILKKGGALTDVLHSLDRVLKERGHEKLKLRVLKELKNILDVKNTKAIVTVARAGDEAVHKRSIDAALRAIDAGDAYATVVDPSIVGGFIAQSRAKQLDQSYKKALVELYQNTIHTI